MAHNILYPLRIWAKGIDLVPLHLHLLVPNYLPTSMWFAAIHLALKTPTFSSGTGPHSCTKETGPQHSAHVTHCTLRLFSGGAGMHMHTHGEGHMGFGFVMGGMQVKFRC